MKRLRIFAFLLLLIAAVATSGRTTVEARSDYLLWCYEEQECDPGWCLDRQAECYAATNWVQWTCSQVTECNGCGFICWLPPA